MTPKLSGHVLAEDPDGVRVLLNPDEPLPDWAEGAITNPKAWLDSPEPEPEPEPKRR